MTRWMEADLSKARILALYLNLIEWGDGVYGCEAAARHWYGKPASDLSPPRPPGSPPSSRTRAASTRG